MQPNFDRRSQPSDAPKSSRVERGARRLAELQREKQEILDWLEKKLTALEQLYRPGHTGWIDGRTDEEKKDKTPRKLKSVTWKKGKPFCHEEFREIELGALFTDGEWGIVYQFSTQSVPREVVERYLKDEAKRRLEVLVDEEIIINQLASLSPLDPKRPSYQALLERLHTENLATGVVAEKMVRIFLTKLGFRDGADFEIQRANAYDDVHGKMDFIVRLKTWSRGVKVEDGALPEAVGIQFTTNDSSENATQKKRQVDNARKRLDETSKVDDIVAVTIPMEEAVRVYRHWRDTLKSPSGGPDTLWNEGTKFKIFSKVFERLHSPEEIQEQWDRLQGRAPEEQKLAA